MVKVTLREITRNNWRECVNLNPGVGQEKFVAPNVWSLAQAHYEPFYVPLGIYTDAKLVGFVMYGFDPIDKNYWIYRLMVDEQEQGKGYGRAGLIALLDRLREWPDCSQVVISWLPANQRAEKLYLSLGFVNTGEMVHDEVLARLHFGITSQPV